VDGVANLPKASCTHFTRTIKALSVWLRPTSAQPVLLVVAAAFFIAFFARASFAQATRPAAWRVQVQPARVVNGSPVLFKVMAPAGVASLEGSWLEHEILFRRSASCRCWYAIAGVGLATKPGGYPLELEGAAAGGNKAKFTYTVSVGEGKYPSTAIKVAPQYVEPPKETMARIEQEQTLKKEIFSETSPESYWKGAFVPPAPASTSGVFGSARLFNGVKRNQHTGLDFRASTGTPVHAANSGKVLLARNLYFEGNCVAIDHGQGLITLYMHFSAFKVTEGEMVKKGQLIGLSGGTGRATAPHLHFAVRWQGAYVNPAVLLKLLPPS
jgi:murein DD-endopeptidase MepM/ murein hydrolase activator NlpD